MCACTPTKRTPWCQGCGPHLLREIERLRAEVVRAHRFFFMKWDGSFNCNERRSHAYCDGCDWESSFAYTDGEPSEEVAKQAHAEHVRQILDGAA